MTDKLLVGKSAGQGTYRVPGEGSTQAFCEGRGSARDCVPHLYGDGVLFKMLALGLTTMGGLIPASSADVAGQPVQASEGCHATPSGYTCFYGPFRVGPEGKRILDLVAAPDEAGYVTEARATVVDRNNDAVSPHMVHLHHAVWVNPVADDLTCAASPGERFFASGKERTPMDLPDGYGYRWTNEASSQWPYSGRKGWGLVAHLDGMHDMTHGGIYIRLRMGFTPESEGVLDEIRPVWIDVNGSCAQNPVFDVPKDDERFRIGDVLEMPETGRFIGMGGHLHDGGLRLRLRNATTQSHVFTSRAVYDDPNYRWFLTEMTSFYRDDPSDETLQVDEGDLLRLTAVYDASRRREDAMGIMMGTLVPE